MKPAIIFVCFKILSFKNFRIDLGNPIRKDGTGLRAEVLLPNWKPKEVEARIWNFAVSANAILLKNLELESTSIIQT